VDNNAWSRCVQKSFIIEADGEYILLGTEGNSFILTDIIVSNKKMDILEEIDGKLVATKNEGANVLIEIKDENNNSFELIDLDKSVPIFSQSFTGAMMFWRDCKLVITKTGGKKVTVVVNYVPLKSGIHYSIWGQREKLKWLDIKSAVQIQEKKNQK